MDLSSLKCEFNWMRFHSSGLELGSSDAWAMPMHQTNLCRGLNPGFCGSGKEYLCCVTHSSPVLTAKDRYNIDFIILKDGLRLQKHRRIVEVKEAERIYSTEGVMEGGNLIDRRSHTLYTFVLYVDWALPASRSSSVWILHVVFFFCLTIWSDIMCWSMCPFFIPFF